MEQSLDLLWFLAFSEEISVPFTVVSSCLCNSGLVSRAHSEFTLVLSRSPFQSHMKWFKDSLAKLPLNWAFPALALTDTVALPWSLMKGTPRSAWRGVQHVYRRDSNGGQSLNASNQVSLLPLDHTLHTVRERSSHGHDLPLCLCEKTHNLLLKQSKNQNDKDKTYCFHVGLIYPCKL